MARGRRFHCDLHRALWRGLLSPAEAIFHWPGWLDFLPGLATGALGTLGPFAMTRNDRNIAWDDAELSSKASSAQPRGRRRRGGSANRSACWWRGTVPNPGRHGQRAHPGCGELPPCSMRTFCSSAMARLCAGVKRSICRRARGVRAQNVNDHRASGFRLPPEIWAGAGTRHADLICPTRCSSPLLFPQATVTLCRLRPRPLLFAHDPTGDSYWGVHTSLMRGER